VLNTLIALIPVLTKKDKNIQIPVSMDTFLKWQNTYYKYKDKYKYKSREEFLLLLLNQFANRNVLDLTTG